MTMSDLVMYLLLQTSS